MAGNTLNDNTLTSYLGIEFQQSLMWQLLVEPDFALKTLPDLKIEYFDDPNLKRLFLIVLEYFKEYEKVPNIQNTSIVQAINKFKTPNNPIEEETLFSIIKRIKLWNERVLNKQLLYNGDVIQKQTIEFIKQQEYRKLGEFIIYKTKRGEIKNKETIFEIEERFSKISDIGSEEDFGTEIIEGVESALRREFRQTIPTGVRVIDSLTGGGLGRAEVGIVLSPSGVGKSTLLTKIANTALEEEKKVLQIIFEDTADQIKRKHYTIWSGVPLSQIDDNRDLVITRVNEKIEKISKGSGKLIIKRFSQEDTTMIDIRNWIDRHEKKWGYKFDILVLDYLDCLEPHKKTYDRNEAELMIIKSFEALAGDLDIPAWTAIQSNRSGFDAELVEAHQSGGSIKRIQKAHFFMSVAKTPDQKEAHLANIRIIKARFAQDGQTFRDCIFNNDSMEIRIEDERYMNTKAIKELKHHDEKDIDRVSKLSDQYQNNNLLDSYLKKINSDDINKEVEDKNDDVKIKESEEINIDELESLLIKPNDDKNNKDIEDYLTNLRKSQKIVKE